MKWWLSLTYRIHRRLAARFLECAKKHQDKAAKIRGLWL